MQVISIFYGAAPILTEILKLQVRYSGLAKHEPISVRRQAASSSMGAYSDKAP
jgi:hypothetical protein